MGEWGKLHDEPKGCLHRRLDAIPPEIMWFKGFKAVLKRKKVQLSEMTFLKGTVTNFSRDLNNVIFYS